MNLANQKEMFIKGKNKVYSGVPVCDRFTTILTGSIKQVS
jgi:hypothetical protein